MQPIEAWAGLVLEVHRAEAKRRQLCGVPVYSYTPGGAIPVPRDTVSDRDKHKHKKRTVNPEYDNNDNAHLASLFSLAPYSLGTSMSIQMRLYWYNIYIHKYIHTYIHTYIYQAYNSN